MKFDLLHDQEYLMLMYITLIFIMFAEYYEPSRLLRLSYEVEYHSIKEF